MSALPPALQTCPVCHMKVQGTQQHCRCAEAKCAGCGNVIAGPNTGLHDDWYAAHSEPRANPFHCSPKCEGADPALERARREKLSEWYAKIASKRAARWKASPTNDPETEATVGAALARARAVDQWNRRAGLLGLASLLLFVGSVTGAGSWWAMALLAAALAGLCVYLAQRAA